MSTLEERVAFLEMLHSPSSAAKDIIGELTIESTQNRTDILYTAEESVKMYQDLKDDIERLFKCLSSHINSHPDKKGKYD